MNPPMMCAPKPSSAATPFTAPRRASLHGKGNAMDDDEDFDEIPLAVLAGAIVVMLIPAVVLVLKWTF